MKLSNNQAECLKFAVSNGHCDQWAWNEKTLASLLNKGLLEVGDRIASPKGKIWHKWNPTESGKAAIKQYNESLRGGNHATEK